MILSGFDHDGFNGQPGSSTFCIFFDGFNSVSGATSGFEDVALSPLENILDLVKRIGEANWRYGLDNSQRPEKVAFLAAYSNANHLTKVLSLFSSAATGKSSLRSSLQGLVMMAEDESGCTDSSSCFTYELCF
jgi:hypothetical protein